MTLSLLANVNRLVIMTLRTVEVDPPVYKMPSDASYPRCIRFLPPLFLAICTNSEIIGFYKFYSDFLLSFRSQTLVNCTSLDSLRCLVYFHNSLKVICATRNHLETDKCWKAGYSCVYLTRPVVVITTCNSQVPIKIADSRISWFNAIFKLPTSNNHLFAKRRALLYRQYSLM